MRRLSAHSRSTKRQRIRMNHWEANRANHPSACTCARCNLQRLDPLLADANRPPPRTKQPSEGKKRGESRPAPPKRQPSKGKRSSESRPAPHKRRPAYKKSGGRLPVIIAGSIIMGVLIFVVARIVIITDVLDPGDPTRELDTSVTRSGPSQLSLSQKSEQAMGMSSGVPLKRHQGGRY